MVKAQRKEVPRPYGREEVIVSVLDAARDLFAERGPASVSTRAIAHKARVNHALIHRHFGTKQNLLREVLHREAIAFSSTLEPITDPATAARQLFEENVRREPFVRILAFSLLSGFPVDDLYSEKGALAPLLQRVVESQGARPDPGSAASIDPRVAVAAVSAFAKGWVLFEPWVTRAVGADRRATSKLREQVADLIEQLMRSAAK
jgi:AcrR family transcriptional regulator